MRSNFNKFPAVRVRGHEQDALQGWDEIAHALKMQINDFPGNRTTLLVECYTGVDHSSLRQRMEKALAPDLVIDTREYMLPEEQIRRITQPDVTNDRIFGFMTRLTLEDLFDMDRVNRTRNELDNLVNGSRLIIGPGATLLAPDKYILVYADMPRWEIQQRMRRNEVSNLGLKNREAPMEEKYKRGYFVDWRICDRVKKASFDRWDWVLDTTKPGTARMVSGEAMRAALDQVVRQPFSVVPFFDPGPWGGQWMKEVCDLDRSADNYAWCFNCVPEENSLLIDFGSTILEIPSVNVVFSRPKALLGDAVHARFGDEFPIRFDFLDTMGGGNLSLQVHPLTEYIQEQFGVHYTQDESYYLMDAKEGAVVYLGLKESVDSRAMIHDLEKAQAEGTTFPDEEYVQQWPVKKHDHLLIPGGTVHCSGKDSMVLEISATPYIFTFKLWDWGRLGMDGKPRPINIGHGKRVIQWDRTTSWTRENLVNRIETVAQGDGWREERTGLHEREFIETRRHWFTREVEHDTDRIVQVMALVEGEEVLVESPEGSFDPFVVHYAETFIIPAAVGRFTVRPHGPSEGKECATIKAYVRTQP